MAVVLMIGFYLLALAVSAGRGRRLDEGRQGRSIPWRV